LSGIITDYYYYHHEGHEPNEHPTRHVKGGEFAAEEQKNVYILYDKDGHVISKRDEVDLFRDENDADGGKGASYDHIKIMVGGRDDHDQGWEMHLAHALAVKGDSEGLSRIGGKENHHRLLHVKDENGWTAVHEGARTGSVEVLKVLLEHGLDVNEVSNFGTGETPLDLALSEHGEEHPVVDFLLEQGALSADEL